MDNNHPGEGQLFQNLKTIIEDKAQRHESDCANYLQYAKPLLFKTQFEIEGEIEKAGVRGLFGDSDYVAAGMICTGGGCKTRRAYIWELKAPQCSIFEKDTDSRLKPTKDLISAENQLLHYHCESCGNQEFRVKFGILDSNEIRLGGIIIGSINTKLKSPESVDAVDREPLYQTALKIRKDKFYSCSGIEIYTWDEVLQYLREPISGKFEPQ